MQRVSVVGTSGSGKTTLSRRIGGAIGAPVVELDAIHHLPGWQPIEPDEFARRLDEIAATERWVVDGNYRAVVPRVWERADTIVWLDLPKAVVMRQILGRTTGRIVRRTELWNGNRESARNLFHWDPERSIVRWAWTTHADVRAKYERLLIDDPPPAVDVVRLRSHTDADAWLETLTPA